jgi:hypothetical protein
MLFVGSKKYKYYQGPSFVIEQSCHDKKDKKTSYFFLFIFFL